jgi:hypothetical protein
MFVSGESACHSRAHPDKPTSFVLPVVFKRTAAEAVNDFVRVIVNFV